MADLSSTSEFDLKPSPAKALPPVKVLFGHSSGAQELVRNLSVIAATDLSILLQGETGTGMEQVARWLHSLSPFAAGRFLMLDSWSSEPLPEHPLGPLPPGIMTQLGYAKSATLFVENVESLDLRTQAWLARLLQDLASSGGTEDPMWPGLGLRIISTTQKDLRAELASGTMRPEFFHCISAFTARLPPLRSRLSEIPELAEHFVQVHAAELGLTFQPLSREANKLLQQYKWPGNLRELEEMLISYVLTGSEPLLLEKVSALQRSSDTDADLSPQPVVADPATGAGNQRLDDEAILKALRENGWNRRQTANRLQISYRSLLYKLKKMDLASGHRRATV